MKLLKQIGVFLAALVAAIAAFTVSMDESEGAVIVPTPKWVLEQAYRVTAPDGREFACVVGEWDGNQAANYNNLKCVKWDNPKAYLGYYETGKLVPVK